MFPDFDVHLGRTVARQHDVWLSSADLLRHTYVIGKTGTGKSNLLENVVMSAIHAGAGVAFIDPHGDSCQRILEQIPVHRSDEVLHFDPKDTEHPVSFNVLAGISADDRPRAVTAIVSGFHHLWDDSWGVRLHDLLFNAIYALMEAEYSLVLIPRFLNDSDFRARVLRRVSHPDILAYWFDEYDNYSPNFRTEVASSTLNKIRRLLIHPIIKNIVGQRRNRLDFRRVMDEGRIVLADLSKGAIGDEAMNLLGGLLIHGIHNASMERADVPEAERKPFFLVCDEFQNFGTGVFRVSLSESRKYGLGLVLAHQFVKQLEDRRVTDAVVGNAGSIMAFRIGFDDAETLEGELDYSATDLMELGNYRARVRLLEDGEASAASTIETVKGDWEVVGNGANIRKASRMRYCVPREKVEKTMAHGAVQRVAAKVADLRVKSRK